MPAPNSQNLRSAHQKQPMPNTAFSKPAGYGPFSGRCRTKCSRAVGIGVGRPGSASAADGISSFFLNMNMAASPVVWPQYRPGSGDAHLSCAPAAAPTPRSIASIPRASDQRLFLPPEQDQDRADDGEHQRDRLIEKVGLDQVLPNPCSHPALDLRLQRRERVLVDVGPGGADAAD